MYVKALPKFIGVLSRDVGIKWNWVTIFKCECTIYFTKSPRSETQNITTLLKHLRHPTLPKIHPVCENRARNTIYY
ncbi:hypothetical protein Hdeb2414_s0034g00726411 [Helianthus debilis subsp. tardiflorus]